MTNQADVPSHLFGCISVTANMYLSRSWTCSRRKTASWAWHALSMLCCSVTYVCIWLMYWQILHRFSWCLRDFATRLVFSWVSVRRLALSAPHTMHLYINAVAQRCCIIIIGFVLFLLMTPNVNIKQQKYQSTIQVPTAEWKLLTLFNFNFCGVNCFLKKN